jgi:hypothetical protein
LPDELTKAVYMKAKIADVRAHLPCHIELRPVRGQLNRCVDTAESACNTR